MKQLEQPRAWMTALFCEDVREEIGGKQSYIGVYGDKVSLPSFPTMLHKLHIIVSIYFDPSWYTPNSVRLELYKSEVEYTNSSLLLHKDIWGEELDNIAHAGEDGFVKHLKVHIIIQDIEINEGTSIHLNTKAYWNYNHEDDESETMNIVSNGILFD